jgi:Domain of unknown function (DUF222)
VVDEFFADEVSCALAWTRKTAQARVDLAMALAQRLPNVLDALLEGRIDGLKAQVIHQVTEHLDPKAAAWVAEQVLVKAHRQSVTQIRDAARRRAYRIRPKETEKAAKKKARQARDVRFFNGSAERVVGQQSHDRRDVALGGQAELDVGSSRGTTPSSTGRSGSRTAISPWSGPALEAGPAPRGRPFPGCRRRTAASDRTPASVAALWPWSRR